eukprot:COSAG02_NODE_5299_length_4460_cov_2.430864_1_plen_72_part_10
MLREIQEQVGVAAIRNVKFEQEADGAVSLVLDLDMRCLQCGQLGVGLTLVVSEPQDAQDETISETVNVHTRM